MKDFVVHYFVGLCCVWVFSMAFGAYVKAVNDKVLYVKDILFGLFFGPFWMLLQVADLNTVLWRAKEKKSGAQ